MSLQWLKSHRGKKDFSWGCKDFSSLFQSNSYIFILVHISDSFCLRTVFKQASQKKVDLCLCKVNLGSKGR